MLQMHGQCLWRYQNASAASREYCKAISGKTPFWARLIINLVQGRNGQDRTWNFEILENNKNIQSIISVNTNILLRRSRPKLLRTTRSTPCHKEHVNFENTLYIVNYVAFTNGIVRVCLGVW
jgi:hypothetical protein